MSYTLKSTGYLIEINDLDASTFQDFMESNYVNSRKIIIVDENTNEFCLEYLLTSFDLLGINGLNTLKTLVFLVLISLD